MDFPLYIQVALMAGMPLSAATYRWSTGRAPSDREKRSWLYLTMIFFPLDMLVVSDTYGVFDRAFVGFEPLAGGIAGGAAFITLYYLFAFGWTDSAEDSTGAGSPS